MKYVIAILAALALAAPAFAAPRGIPGPRFVPGHVHAQQPAAQGGQHRTGGGKISTYVAVYIVAQYFIWVVCERENVEFCKAPGFLRGVVDAPIPGEYTN